MTRTPRLPLVREVPGQHVCAACPAPCCRQGEVLLGSYDVVRLTRGLGLSWTLLVEAFEMDQGPIALGATRAALRLRRRSVGGCPLLLELPGGPGRCGAHALRPGQCRTYPYHAQLDAEGLRLAVGLGAQCPESQARTWAHVAPAWGGEIATVSAEQTVEQLLLGRWELAVRSGARLDVPAFLDWSAALHAALEPLRAAKVVEFLDGARRIVEVFPSPRARTGRRT